MRRRMKTSSTTLSTTLSKLEQERNKWRERMKIRRHRNGRPLCEYCFQGSAQYTGHRRKGDNSLVMRKFQGKYECVDCHQKRLSLSPFFRMAGFVQGESY